MDGRLVREAQGEREALFARMVSAFTRQDYEVFRDTMRSDVIIELPGSSPLAGTHRGHEAMGRFLVAMRNVLRAAGRPPTYSHQPDQMIVRHDIMVHGPAHDVDMAVRLRMTFDDDGKAATILVEPDDLGLFDHVLTSALRHAEAR